MDCYGVGVGRFAAFVCETRHNEFVQLCTLREDNNDVKKFAEMIL